MTRAEFEKLKVGQLVVIKRGHDEGKTVRVIHIEDDTILIKIVDDFLEFRAINTNRKIRLTSWKELDIIKPKKGKES